jgi:hypothetical protein
MDHLEHTQRTIMTPHLEASPPAHVPRDPSQTVLYRVVADHLETFLASLDADPDAKGLPAYVEREFYDYLQCGILAHGFVRLGCETCQHEMLLAFSCKRRGFWRYDGVSCKTFTFRAPSPSKTTTRNKRSQDPPKSPGFTLVI